ncbi:tRNA 2-thiouridine(34) synthase MnmA [Candidatus Berkelbacteria bacterium]|nr:tRNA 2-thiouridine(34) synthase MnmA [Candidatus Berkelbacteria bacterium]
MPKKILLGMSGGVDSSFAASLLKEAGHEVVGVYLRAWSDDLTGVMGGVCPWQEDVADARRVAAFLGIPFTVIDVREAYKTQVVDVMLKEYAEGRTPNPDILCNRSMKFGILLDLARAEGFDAVATGHYAQIHSRSNKTFHTLHRATDIKKDQTYFLWQLTSADLVHIFFPIGCLTKAQVRSEARRRNLPVANKPDSQGICFLGPVDVASFLRLKLKTKCGVVVNHQGRQIGRHDGVALYTLGQRHGFQISDGGVSRPHYYVVGKNFARNQLIVDVEPPASKILVAMDLNWINDPPQVNDQIEARIRHGQQPQVCQVISDPSMIKNHQSKITIGFADPQIAISPGQSVVFSKGSLILGGGTISE